MWLLGIAFFIYYISIRLGIVTMFVKCIITYFYLIDLVSLSGQLQTESYEDTCIIPVELEIDS